MAKDRLTILVRGAHDSFNFGDDLIFIAIYYFLIKDLELGNIVDLYTQRNAHSLDKLSFKFALKLNKSKEINDVIYPINSKLKTLKIPRVLRILCAVFIFGIFLIDICLFRVIGKSLFFKDIIVFFKNLDVIHYIGGGYITDRWRNRMIYEFLTVNVAKMINPNLKIIGTGLGLGPFSHKSSLFFLKRFLGKFDYLFLREQQSFNLVKKLNVKVNVKCLGDDVLLLFPIFENLKYKRDKVNESVVAINLKDFPDHNYNEIRDIISDFLMLADKKNFRIEYFSFGQNPGPDDYDVFQNLRLDNGKVISAVHNPYEEGINTYIQSLNKVKFGFGFAYHFNVILAIMSIPSISIYVGDYYEQKIKGSMALFDMPFVFSIIDLKNQDLGVIINKILQNKWDEEDRIRKLYKNMVKEYTLMYDKLVKIIQSTR